jgi:DNA-binding NarL/FixJ family response regulator
MTSTIRIGLLDADSDVRFGRRMALSSQPKFEIVFDSDGLTDDLEALEQSLIDVLIIDQKLSSGPGLDFYSNLRNIAGIRQAPPAILTTAFDQPTLLLEALQIGIFDVVSLERGAAGLVESVLEANSGSPSRSLLALRQLVDSQPPFRQVDLGFVRLVDDLPVKISSSIRRLKSVWLSSDSSKIEKYNLGSLNEAISRLPVANPVELVLAMSRSGLLDDE